MRRSSLMKLSVLGLLAAPAAIGCDQSPGTGDTGGGGGGTDTGVIRYDTGPPPDSGPGCVYALPIDLLFVVDNSSSMAEEQLNLADNFPDLLSTLTDPPDADEDGMPDFPAAEDVRLGVITTDLGSATYTVPSCDTMGGDRGVLVTSHLGGDPACADVTLPASEPWLSYEIGDDAVALGRQFSCLARVGTAGCGLEQQLESMHAALTTQSTSGMPNAGFVRDDSLLAIVFVTDEEDCSASDPVVFDPARSGDLGPYAVRCANHPELLHSIDRYVTALDNLRLDRRQPIVVGAITGVPTNPAGIDPLSIDLDMLLMDERMQYTEDPGMPGTLTPACDRAGAGSAIPARRVVELARRFAVRSGDGLATSICDDDLSLAMRALGTLIGRRLCPPLE
ncbi:MAG: hypothetical protein J0L92_10730 [Deltaproteobacteria bacterium]|nr:hypothetical protein [Deltaproteobacteria bacterium]